LEVRQDNKTCLERSFVSKIYDQLGRRTDFDFMR